MIRIELYVSKKDNKDSSEIYSEKVTKEEMKRMYEKIKKCERILKDPDWCEILFEKKDEK